MPKIEQPAFPKALSKSSWEKAKGMIAIVSGVKTGVTEQLESAAKQYKASAKAFEKLDVLPLVKELNAANGNAAAHDKLKTQYIKSLRPGFLALEQTFIDLSALLVKKATDFQSNPKLIKFAPVLNLMSNEADKFAKLVAWDEVSRSNLEYLQERINTLEQSERQWAAARGRVTTLIDEAVDQLAKWKTKTPTIKVYDPFLRETLRAIGAQIKMAEKGHPGISDKFAAPLNVAKKLWSQGAVPEQDGMADRILKDIKLVGQFKNIDNNA